MNTDVLVDEKRLMTDNEKRLRTDQPSLVELLRRALWLGLVLLML